MAACINGSNKDSAQVTWVQVYELIRVLGIYHDTLVHMYSSRHLHLEKGFSAICN